MWVPPSAACPLSLVSYCRFSGPVSCGRAPGPRPPHWLESSLLPPLSHTLTLQETCSETHAHSFKDGQPGFVLPQSLFFFFPFPLSYSLCSPCYGSLVSTVCVREPFHAVLLAFSLNIVCFFFHYWGLCLLDAVLGFGCGDGSGSPWGGFSLHVMGACHSLKITQTLHHLEPL